MKSIALAFIAALALGAGLAQPAAAAGDYTFTTTADFVRDCDVSSPPEECAMAISHVEEVIDNWETPNATCDGGLNELVKSASNAELIEKLMQRLARVVPWLKAHPDYDAKPYEDGVWAGLRGAYCS
ncbi:MAG TPA: hypothetical protein VF459_10080 [Caulobacteraceae bacterium]